MKVARDICIHALPQGLTKKERKHAAKVLTAIYDSTINARFIFPDGRMFQVKDGMKSGWLATAPDNTIIHIYVTFRALYEIAVKNSKGAHQK